MTRIVLCLQDGGVVKGSPFFRVGHLRLSTLESPPLAGRLSGVVEAVPGVVAHCFRHDSAICCDAPTPEIELNDGTPRVTFRLHNDGDSPVPLSAEDDKRP